MAISYATSVLLVVLNSLKSEWMTSKTRGSLGSHHVLGLQALRAATPFLSILARSLLSRSQGSKTKTHYNEANFFVHACIKVSLCHLTNLNLSQSPNLIASLTWIKNSDPEVVVCYCLTYIFWIRWIENLLFTKNKKSNRMFSSPQHNIIMIWTLWTQHSFSRFHFVHCHLSTLLKNYHCLSLSSNSHLLVS